jgi:hypothetical protein
MEMAKNKSGRNEPFRRVGDGAITPDRDPPGPPPVAAAITKPALDPTTGQAVEPQPATAASGDQ